AAHNERFFYAVLVLLPQAQWDRMTEVLAPLPPTHENYYLARTGVMEALTNQLESVEDEEKEQAIAEKLHETAASVQQRAEGDLGATSDPQAESRIRTAWARARLVLADVAIREGRTDDALRFMDGFEADFPNQARMVREALEKRIMAYLRGSRFDAASDQALKMVKRFAGNPELEREAIDVLKRVQLLLEQDINNLISEAEATLVERDKAEMIERAKAMAQAAVKMGNALLNWAHGRELPQEEMVDFRAMLANALRLTGQTNQAITMLEPIYEANPNDAGILHSMAEAYFARAVKDGKVVDEAMLKEKARPIYIRLISDLGPGPDGNYPDIWWNAWVKVLKMNSLLGEGVEDIAIRVEQLRKGTSANLGGQPYKRELEKLQLRHAQ
ncbi:MAG: hypothetical protein R3336_01225, partial [Phycisphaeraceae bacterium]|nr:hypothetical protein [Phycisphaeraceae bacterium]